MLFVSVGCDNGKTIPVGGSGQLDIDAIPATGNDPALDDLVLPTDFNNATGGEISNCYYGLLVYLPKIDAVLPLNDDAVMLRDVFRAEGQTAPPGGGGAGFVLRLGEMGQEMRKKMTLPERQDLAAIVHAGYYYDVEVINRGQDVRWKSIRGVQGQKNPRQGGKRYSLAPMPKGLPITSADAISLLKVERTFVLDHVFQELATLPVDVDDQAAVASALDSLFELGPEKLQAFGHLLTAFERWATPAQAPRFAELLKSQDRRVTTWSRRIAASYAKLFPKQAIEFLCTASDRRAAARFAGDLQFQIINADWAEPFITDLIADGREPAQKLAEQLPHWFAKHRPGEIPGRVKALLASDDDWRWKMAGLIAKTGDPAVHRIFFDHCIEHDAYVRFVQSSLLALVKISEGERIAMISDIARKRPDWFGRKQYVRLFGDWAEKLTRGELETLLLYLFDHDLPYASLFKDEHERMGLEACHRLVKHIMNHFAADPERAEKVDADENRFPIWGLDGITLADLKALIELNAKFAKETHFRLVYRVRQLPEAEQVGVVMHWLETSAEPNLRHCRDVGMKLSVENRMKVAMAMLANDNRNVRHSVHYLMRDLEQDDLFVAVRQWLHTLGAEYNVYAWKAADQLNESHSKIILQDVIDGKIPYVPGGRILDAADESMRTKLALIALESDAKGMDGRARVLLGRISQANARSVLLKANPKRSLLRQRQLIDLFGKYGSPQDIPHIKSFNTWGEEPNRDQASVHFAIERAIKKIQERAGEAK